MEKFTSVSDIQEANRKIKVILHYGVDSSAPDESLREQLRFLVIAVESDREDYINLGDDLGTVYGMIRTLKDELEQRDNLIREIRDEFGGRLEV